MYTLREFITRLQRLEEEVGEDYEFLFPDEIVKMVID
jgi:uncharacterized protein (UPF0335 family)